MDGISSFSLSDHLGAASLGFEWLVLGIELFAILILLLGLLRFIKNFVSGEMHRRDGHERSHRLNLGRLELGRHILTGMEVLIVADLIRTMLDLNIENIILLGGLVTIRSLISFFLERELSHLQREDGGREDGTATRKERKAQT
ncbi:DUF1622 domain-containing protein [Paracoccus tibetensis]|uniref:Uncharacterized membrane protein n=1 Tax=Paracoccus tibetensis TaxID=336292 RepID=A0A1G5FJU7_9RHOB|nr:DUF1622 domain-containing protein [Paracoccus tibetensis]SCY39503.1 Uncharacterized membrane protein [Paracoccus tibetensis]